MKARTQQEFAKKWVGLVEVVTGESTAKFTAIEVNKEGKKKLFPEDETSIKIKLADLPKPAQRVIKANMKEPKKFRIRLNEDGDEVETVTPVSGVFPAKLVGLGPKNREGGYKLIEKVYNQGTEKENSHLEFLAIYEVINTPWLKEVELPGYYLHYKFEAIPEGEEDEGFTRFDTVDSPQASQLHRLQEWSAVHGNILDEPIEFPDDGIILETLEERALANDRLVNLIFEKGYIKSVQAQENYDDESEEDFDEKFPAKKEPAKTKGRNVPEPVDEVEEVKPKGKTVTKKPIKRHADDDEDL